MATDNFVSFDEFLKSTASAKPAELIANADTKVSSEREFKKMKAHILAHYKDVSPAHSFMTEAGQYVDCIPIDQQASLRAQGTKKTRIAKAPEAPAASPSSRAEADETTEADEGAGGTGASKLVGKQFASTGKDKFGNKTKCPEGCIPVLRITLDTMTRFSDLKEFFRKAPAVSTRSPFSKSLSALAVTHKYAHAYQTVNNWGGNSGLNLWSPSVGSGQFSLTQQWYVGGSGSSLQTVEGGVQVYPQLYGTNLACPFIYWTSANYTNGCYNLSCSAFVQTGSAIAFGVPWASQYYSTTNGTQYKMTMAWQLFQKNWWLQVKLANGWTNMGYYPTSLYGSGQLSKFATKIDYGGETTGTTSWPKMGSGAFANTGFAKAAFQNQIFYLNTSGTSVWSSLNSVQNSPSCYTIQQFSSSDSNWGKYFYFGGPGGTTC